MKATEIKYSEIVNYLVSVFSDNAKAAAYMAGDNAQYFLLCGWAKNVVNAPANRAAFLATFGEAKTAQAEQEARDILQARARSFESSQYYAHTIEADAHAAAGQPAPAPGSFVWALATGLKAGNGLPGVFNDLFWDDQQKTPHARRALVQVEKVYKCTAADVCARNYAPSLVAANMPFSGGATSDDYNINEIDWSNKEQARTVYTVAAAVVDPSGRWFLIDSEGYNYARYILLPLDARRIFADLYGAAVEEEQAREQAQREQAQQEAAAVLADYNARAARWAGLMEDLTAARAEFLAAPWQDKKRHAAAARALKAGQRRNVAAMIRAAFPGLKISITKEKYNNSYCVAWCNGPTVAEMLAAVDFDLFAARARRWDATDENGERITADLSTFAARYMCDNSVTITTDRQTATDDAPHVSLSLADMPGGVYVQGSTRATYCNRKAIKSHGGQWNKTAGRWEATEPAAVDALRAWFRLQKSA